MFSELPDDVVAYIVRVACLQMVTHTQTYQQAIVMAQVSRRMFGIITSKKCAWLWKRVACTEHMVRQQLGFGTIASFVADHVERETVTSVYATSILTDSEWHAVATLCSKHASTMEQMTLGMHRIACSSAHWTRAFESLSRLTHLAITFPPLDHMADRRPPLLPVIPSLTILDVHVRSGPARATFAAALWTPQPSLVSITLSTNYHERSSKHHVDVMNLASRHPRLTSLVVVMGSEDLLQTTEVLPALTHADISFAKQPPFESYAFLDAFPQLKSLTLTHLFHRHASTIIPMAHLPASLRTLHMHHVYVGDDASSVRHCTALRELVLIDPQDLGSLDGLGTMSALQTLRIESADMLRTLHGIGSCASLQSLLIKVPRLMDCGDLHRLRQVKCLRLFSGANNQRHLDNVPLDNPSFTQSLETIEINSWDCAALHDTVTSFPVLSRIVVTGRCRVGAGWLLEQVAASNAPLTNVRWPYDPGLRFSIMFPHATALLLRFGSV